MLGWEVIVQKESDINQAGQSLMSWTTGHYYDAYCKACNG
jgi:hypothetical protein